MIGASLSMGDVSFQLMTTKNLNFVLELILCIVYSWYMAFCRVAPLLSYQSKNHFLFNFNVLIYKHLSVLKFFCDVKQKSLVLSEQ